VCLSDAHQHRVLTYRPSPHSIPQSSLITPVLTHHPSSLPQAPHFTPALFTPGLALHPSLHSSPQARSLPQSSLITPVLTHHPSPHSYSIWLCLSDAHQQRIQGALSLDSTKGGLSLDSAKLKAISAIAVTSRPTTVVNMFCSI
jgi:hypothetical protein